VLMPPGNWSLFLDSSKAAMGVSVLAGSFRRPSPGSRWLKRC